MFVFTDDEGEGEKRRRELSSSYCAVAELFMTDLCDAEEAETECSGCIQKAVEADEANPEAWQTKARLHLIKSEFEVGIEKGESSVVSSQFIKFFFVLTGV